MVKEIPLQNGMVALVDDEDFERVKGFLWIENQGRVRRKKDDGTVVELKREIIGDTNLVVLFKDKNNLNFQKDNIELVKHQKAIHGSKGHKDSSSKYKGVSWNKQKNKWRVRIRDNRKERHIGFFDDESLAAKAYDKVALEVYGEYAFLNFSDNKKPIVTERENVKQFRTNNKTGFKGVKKKAKKFESYISANGKSIHIGLFDTPEQAAKAYDQKAIELYGDKAILNFPKETTLKIGGNQNE